MTVALLFLGHFSRQAEAFIPYLAEHGYEVTVINTEHLLSFETVRGTNIPVINLYEESKIRALSKSQAWRLAKAAVYNAAKNLELKQSKLKRIIETRGIELIYGGWGSFGLPEFGFAQEFNLPTVYEFLTYPCGSTLLSQRIENFFNRQIINELDGRVFSTQRMHRYMKNEFDIDSGKNLVFMECYPEKFFYRKRLPLLSSFDGQPHIVFVGMRARYEILTQIEEIASRKIHVHICDLNQDLPEANTKEKLTYNNAFKNSDFIHTFDMFTYREIADGTFATFLTQFDAVLVTYNFWRASGLDKFDNSIPSRFSSALLGGIPIIVPKGYLKGCEEVLDKYQIGFTYENYDALKNKLSNKSYLSYYQDNAVEKAKSFSLEANFPRMDKFLKQMIE
jgi:hypothetical protein